MTTRDIRAIIVDDDAPARTRLRLLAAQQHDLTVVAECSDGREAVESLSECEVDLVFMDVEMPGINGFDVLGEVGVGRMPPVIFTSAYSEFAVRAFEAYALDYLLKPFDDARFVSAVARARREIEDRKAARIEHASPTSEIDKRLLALLEHVGKPARTHYPDAIAARAGGQYSVLRLDEVDWIEADGNYARVHSKQRSRVVTTTLTTLEKEVLDPAVFVRVHRSAIVNTKKVAAVEPHTHGDLTLVLQDGTRVECSRRYRKNLDDKLYFTS